MIKLLLAVRFKIHLKKNSNNCQCPLVVLPPLVHLCVPTVVLARAPAMAAKRREGAVAVPQQAGALRHLRHSVLGLFLSLSTSASTAVRSGSDGSPDPVALHWAPDAFQALAAFETGAGRADAGCVVRGGAGDGDLTRAVASCYWFIVLQGFLNRTFKTILLDSISISQWQSCSIVISIST